MNQKKEIESLSKAMLGDTKSFDIIYSFYYPLVTKFILKFVKSQSIAEDITQDIFLNIWNKRADLAKVVSFKAYLFTIAKNQTLNFLRKAATNSTVAMEIINNCELISPSVDNQIQTKEYFEYLNGLINNLTPQSREIFYLCRQEKKTYQEIAEQLQISTNTVKKHVIKNNKFFKYALMNDLNISFLFFYTLAQLLAS